ncbi:YihY/virulence factor BrkB family protein [Myroides sp. LJL115]
MLAKSVGMKVFLLFKKSIMDFMSDNAMKFSAALSYYTIFAFPPLLIIIISASSVFFEQQEVADFFYGQLSDLVGDNTAFELRGVMENLAITRSGILPTIISIAMLLFSASGVFAEIQSSINYMWGFAAAPHKSIAQFIRNRIISFSMIASVGFLLLVSLLVNSLISLLSNFLKEFIDHDILFLVELLNNMVVFGIITFLFALIFKALPNGRICWRDTLIGSGFTAILFMVGKFAIGFYLGSSATSSLYGAAGSLIVMLIWVYYSAMILYFGAEFTKNYALLFGNRIMPGADSVEIRKNVIKN